MNRKMNGVVVCATAMMAIVACDVMADSLPARCGPLENHYGPFDYRSPAVPESRELVESFHFTPKVEALQGGQSGLLAQDIAYTLRVFPNHARALNAVANFELRKLGGRGDNGAFSLPTDCWFLRGIAWRPDDEAVRMIFGNYLAKRGDRVGARGQYEAALKITPDSAETHYNFGLLLFDLGDLSQSADHARKAYELGYPLPGLRNKLTKAGVSLESAAKR